MILLCDENVGVGIPTALTAVDLDARALVRVGWRGQQDREWLPRAGELQWLVFSYNKKQLLVPGERKAIIDNRVGIVYLTNGEEKPAKVLALLLKKWDDLELLDRTEPRPFARFLSPNGYLRDTYKHYSL